MENKGPLGMGVAAKGGAVKTVKSKKKKPKGKGRPAGAGLLLGKNSPFNSIPILGSIL